MLTKLPIKLLYDLAKASQHLAIYYLQYNKKSGITKSVYKPSLFWLSPRLTESAYNHFLFQLPQKLLSLLGISSHCIIKVINPLHDMPDTGKY